jgi:hypothetical protein
MAEIQIQRIKSLYGEIKGLLATIKPTDYNIHSSIVKQYNAMLDDLSTASLTDYSRSRITHEDYYPRSSTSYLGSVVRAKMNSLIKRLEEEFGFGSKQPITQGPTIVVTQNQHQQLNVTVIPIQQVIDSITDNDELRAEVEELKALLEAKDNKGTSKVLGSIMNKSWDIFVALLPAVLENMGKLPGQ